MGQLQLAPGCAREYETIYILRPSCDKDAADAVANKVHDAIKGEGGVLTGVELWGRRRLAYQISRHYRGIYIYLKYLGKGNTVNELERQLRLLDNVIRFQTIQLRSNVPVADVNVDPGALEIEYELTDEPDAPELPIEKELGLDAPPPERRRRERWDRDRRDEETGPEEAKAEEASSDGSAGGDAGSSEEKEG